MKTRKLAFVIDDSESYQKMVQLHLSQLGFTVISFFRVEDCLDHRERNPDVILLDQNLGDGIYGIDWLKALRLKMPYAPIIFLSADGNLSIVTEAIKKGAHDYIEKNAAAFVRLRTTLDVIFSSKDKQKRIRQKFLAVASLIIVSLTLILLWYTTQ